MNLLPEDLYNAVQVPEYVISSEFDFDTGEERKLETSLTAYMDSVIIESDRGDLDYYQLAGSDPDTIELFGILEGSWARGFIDAQEYPIKLEADLYYASLPESDPRYCPMPDEDDEDDDLDDDDEDRVLWSIGKPWRLSQLAYIASYKLSESPNDFSIILRGQRIRYEGPLCEY